MAVYTALEFDEIATLVAPLALGRLLRAEGIAAGVENTTYFLAIERNQRSVTQYVLTIAETLARADLEFIASLMHALNARGLPVPSPVYAPSPDISSDPFCARRAVLSVREKPALLVPRVAGAHPQSITPALCHSVGQALARLHLATLDMHDRHESHRSLAWVDATGCALLPHVKENDRRLLDAELKALREFVNAGNTLPRAIIHGDLFRDNVLVEDGRITAFIDFFSAGTGYVLLDIAIAVNDWCFDDRGNPDRDNYAALTAGYCAVRSPEREEIRHWGGLLRIAALRFWVSRLNEQVMAGPHAPRGRGKNPAPYRRLVLRHRDQPLPLNP